MFVARSALAAASSTLEGRALTAAVTSAVSRRGKLQASTLCQAAYRPLSASSSRPQPDGSSDVRPSRSDLKPSQKRAPRRGEGREDRHTSKALVSETRRKRSQENAGAPRFQEFGRIGGEGHKVAAGLYEDFGMSEMHGESSTAVDEEQRVEWLEEEVKISARAAAKMLGQEPRIAGETREAIGERLAWLKERLQMTEEQVRSLVFRRPSLLCRDVDGGMERNARWLQDSLGYNDSEIASILTSAPNVLSSSVSGGISPKLEWLTKRLGLSREESAMVIASCPQILTSSIEDSLEERLAWIKEYLKINEGVLRRRVLDFPRLLTLSVSDKLVPTYEFLKVELLQDEAEIRRNLFRNPRFFLTPLQTSLFAFKSWLRKSIGLEEEHAMEILRTDPRLLLRSIDVLESKVEYFIDDMGATHKDLREVLLRSPNLLLVSVPLFLAPRVEAMERKGLKVSFALDWNTLAFGPAGDDFETLLDKRARRRRV